MIIAVEGIDKVGKDTLIKGLQKNLGGYILTSRRPLSFSTNEADQVSDRYDCLYDNAAANNPIISIINRCHMSEMVYSGVMRKRSRIDDPAMADLTKKFGRYSGILVYLFNTDSTELARRFAREREEYVVKEHIRLLFPRYDVCLEKFELDGVNVIKIDTTNKTAEEVLKEVMDKI